MADWALVALEDLVEPERPITYGVVKPGDDPYDGVLFLRGQDVRDGQIISADARRITPEVSVQYSRTLLHGGEVVVVLVGTPGESAVVPDSLKGANIARQLALLSVKNSVSPEYVSMYLRSPLGQSVLAGLTYGSVQQVINLGDLRRMRIPLPSLTEQRAIAGVLGALEDKIESNRRRSSIAAELYQTEIRDMLLKLPDNGLGSLQQLSTFMSRSSERIGDVYAPEFSATVTGLEPRSSRFKKTLSAGNQKNKKIQTGDLVFGFSRRTLSFGVMRDPIGSVSPVYEVFSVHGGLEIAGLIEMQIRDQMHDFMDILKPGAREGQPIEAKYLLNKKLVLPNNPDGFIISEQIKNLARVVELSVSENRKLTMLRDTLLPELLSGRLRVKGAELMMENV
jgi:type I restriction enzyme S subunit